MGLEKIISKQPIVDTPPAHDLAGQPHEHESRFRFHVSTHVALADLTDKWEKMIRNLEQGKSVTGLIYADTGYGKTSTAASLWQYAEDRSVVAVPPFMWESMTDMLKAAHGWISYRLKARRPDLLPTLQAEYDQIQGMGLDDLISRMSREQGVSAEDARKIVTQLRRDGQVTDVVSSNRLLDYLSKATKVLVEAGFKGLLLLPDEFELFESSNPDIAKNFAQLKEFIFPLFQMENLPLGCVVSTYNKTQATIKSRESYMLARFNKPEGSLINLEAVYGSTVDGTSFPEALWEKLGLVSDLTQGERQAVSDDVLAALGQFLSHSRTTAIFSGPRSVVATFRRAAIHYGETGTPYSIFDFCEDYLNSGTICYNQQEIETARAYTAISNLGVTRDSESRKKILQLLCVMPGGIPPEMFARYGIPDEDRQVVVQGLLGTYTTTTVVGPILLHYKPNPGGNDQVVELLREMRDRHNPGGQPTLRAAVRAFVNHLLPHILSARQGTAQTGWASLQKMQTDLQPTWTSTLRGSALELFPDRTLAVHVGDEQFRKEEGQHQYTDLFVRFILVTDKNREQDCRVLERGLEFHLDVTRPFDPNAVPRAVAKLEDVFLPEKVTPLLLLDMLDFFDSEETKAQIERLNQHASIGILRQQIVNELTKRFFSEAVKATAVVERPTLERIPIGKDMVERALAVITQERFPEYRAVAVSSQWSRVLEKFSQILKDEPSLGVRRGLEPRQLVSNEVPGLFGIGSHSSFKSTYYPSGVLRHMMRIDELDSQGKTLSQGIESTSSQKPVAVYFLLHPLEQAVLEDLERSADLMPGRVEKTIRVSRVYDQGNAKGYTSDEVKQLLEVLSARGLTSEEDLQGVKYLLLQKTEISLAELAISLTEIEGLETAARAKGFSPEWEQSHRPEALRRRVSDPDVDRDEVAKDQIRRGIRDARDSLQRQCAQWLARERNELSSKQNELATYKLEMPSLLTQTSGHPNTDFSTLLFMDIRNDVSKQYVKHNQHVERLNNQIVERAGAEVTVYVADKSMGKAIDVAATLAAIRKQTEIDISALDADADTTRKAFAHYQQWRNLARRVEQLRLSLAEMADDETARQLLSRLDSEQALIKRHMADRSQTVAQVLDDYEHFGNRIEELEKELSEITANRSDRFLQYQSKIQETLGTLLTRSTLQVVFNPIDEEGCYRSVREQAVEKLTAFCDNALSRLYQVQQELLKPLEVFQVSEGTRIAAASLREEVCEASDLIIAVKNSLTPQSVDSCVENWVQSLSTVQDESVSLNDRYEDIQDSLRSPRDQLTESARRLLAVLEERTNQDLTELIVKLRGSAASQFQSTAEIIAGLEELYQRNWINLHISSTIQP